MDNLIVRPALDQDRDTILSFTLKTFEWGDYIAEVWSDWLESPGGRLLVAEFDGRAVGMLHLVLCGNGEAWMEGMRVHPDFRRHRVSTRLDAAAQDIAREEGCRVARLMSARDNYNAHAAVESFGYRRVGSFGEWSAPFRQGNPACVRAATTADLNALVSLWTSSTGRESSHDLIPLLSGWRWGEYTSERFRAWIEKDRIRLAPAQGDPLTFVFFWPEEDGANILLPSGHPRDVKELLNGLVAMPLKSERANYWFLLPENAESEALMSAVGAKPSGGVVLYELQL